MKKWSSFYPCCSEFMKQFVYKVRWTCVLFKLQAQSALHKHNRTCFRCKTAQLHPSSMGLAWWGAHILTSQRWKQWPSWAADNLDGEGNSFCPPPKPFELPVVQTVCLVHNQIMVFTTFEWRLKALYRLTDMGGDQLQIKPATIVQVRIPILKYIYSFSTSLVRLPYLGKLKGML